MKLFAWQPKGHGQLSWFVAAEDENQARLCVESEMARRLALPKGHMDRITEHEIQSWGTGYYEVSVAEPGTVLSNFND